MPPEQVVATVSSFLGAFPPELVHLQALQLSRDDGPQQ